MKKTLLLLITVISGIILTSFISHEKTSSNTKTNVEGYFEKVLAYDIEEEEYRTMYIFYHEDDDTYGITPNPKGSSIMDRVYRNRLYKRCNDRRREFRYVSAGRYYYFNAKKLPNDLMEI